MRVLISSTNWLTSLNCRYTEANRTYATSSTCSSFAITRSPIRIEEISFSAPDWNSCSRASTRCSMVS